MRGDRRSASFRKEKSAGLSRALSWLSVSTLSRQSRRIFHSQNELHAVHNRHAYSHSHTHLHSADRDEDDDDDDSWVYHPQHKIGGMKCWSMWLLLILLVRYDTLDANPPNYTLCLIWLHHNLLQCSELVWMDFCSHSLPGSQWMTFLHAQAKQEVGHCFFMAPCSLSSCPWHFLVSAGSEWEVWAVSGITGLSKGTLCVP